MGLKATLDNQEVEGGLEDIQLFATVDDVMNDIQLESSNLKVQLVDNHQEERHEEVLQTVNKK